jgi:hypothetical protein
VKGIDVMIAAVTNFHEISKLPNIYISKPFSALIAAGVIIGLK